MTFARRIRILRFLAILLGWLGGFGFPLFAGEIGEMLTGSPVVVQNSEGYLEVFRVDAEGELYHKWQKEAGGDWSPWVSLGGWLLPDVAAAREADGCLDVFAVDKMSRLLRWKQQLEPNRPESDWSDWATLGGSATFQPPVVAAQNQEGHLEVFAVDADSGVLKHIWQDTTFSHSSKADSWSRWEDIGNMRIDPGFAVAANADGRLEIFGINTSTRELVHSVQIVSNGRGGWSPWRSLKGNVDSRITVARNSDGRLELFGINRTSGSVDHIYQTSTNSENGWSSWSSLGGNFKSGIAVGRRGNGSLELFVINGKDTTLLRSFQAKPGDSESWSAWENIGGSVRPIPAVGRNSDGNLEVFAGDGEHAAILNHRRQISHNSGWLDWLNMDQPSYQYASRIWQISEGLPHNEVQAITQTLDGYLWIGTHDGLARFDGINYTHFNSRNTPEIKNDSISALCVDRDGSLWIGTEGGGLVRLKEGAFTQFNHTNGLAGDNVTSLCEDREGSIWIGTTTGLSRFANGEFSSFRSGDGLASNLIRALCSGQDGSLWIASDGGLNHWKRDFKESFTTANGLPNNSVRGIYSDRNGKLWIGTDSGMSLYSDGRFYSYDTHYGLADRVVSAICGDRRGNLWVGTFGGLNRFQEGRFLNELNNEGLPFDRINAFFEDREGNLWVGSKEGLIRFTPKRFFAYTKRQGLTHNNVVSVMEDRARNLWVGTWGGALDKLRGEVVTIPTGFTNNYVLSLCESYDGIWIGSDFDGGLAKYKNGEFTYYNWQDGLIRTGLKVLHEDRFLNLWIGTSKGLSCFRNGKFTHYTTREGLSGNDVRAICEDAQGNLWFGTDGGLSRWNDGKFENLTTQDGLSDNSVTTLYGDNDRNLWIGTASGGLNRFFNGRFSAYTTKEGLFSDEIFEVLEDDYGWMWMSCSKGVFRVRKSDFDSFDQNRSGSVFSIAYGKADGMESTQCNGVAKPGAWKARDGKLWFPTTKGVVAVDPKIEIQNTPPPVFIEDLLADGQSVRSLGMNAENKSITFLTRPYGGKSTNAVVQIPPGRGELELHFTALNFQTPEKSRFRYRLEGVDPDWVEAGRRRTVHYNNLSPGRYRFQVLACNSDGVWNTKGASLSIVLLPHFWQTKWFLAFVALLFAGAVYSAARYTTKWRMQRKLELLKQQHAIERERGRIARDIHDDLGSSLTRIMMLGERVQDEKDNRDELEIHVKKIVNCARETVQTLDEIVWAVNPENDTLDGLVAYINQYTSQFLESANITCRLEMPAEISTIRLSAEVRHDLFLTVKEALGNILKHSRATEVRVQISHNADSIEIVIEDNGCGFAENTNGSGRKGHGMENMRRRSENCGGKISVSSVSGKGTRITIRVPMRTMRR
ncbi:MAG TPA: two-component regulator propeller domain-containing protein [Verrucomicrobiae bacterium]|nr:two-component regulator propeller domain-containing protein [Verrucomicrobiae bacterium]